MTHKLHDIIIGMGIGRSQYTSESYAGILLDGMRYKCQYKFHMNGETLLWCISWWWCD